MLGSSYIIDESKHVFSIAISIDESAEISVNAVRFGLIIHQRCIVIFFLCTYIYVKDSSEMLCEAAHFRINISSKIKVILFFLLLLMWKIVRNLCLVRLSRVNREIPRQAWQIEFIPENS